MNKGAESKSPAASSQKPRAQIVNMAICSESQSTRQWAKMGFCDFAHFNLSGIVQWAGWDIARPLGRPVN
jgi:hypothetical protein